MRASVFSALVVAALLIWGCDGGSGSSKTTATPAAPASTPVTSPSTGAPVATSPAPDGSGATAEVTGIVGTVSAATHAIEIDRRSGADVRKIVVDASTVFRRAGGGDTTLSQIKPSDRIIARGRLDDRNDALIASEVEVQSVLPGAQPGG